MATTTKKKGANVPTARDVPVVNNVSLSCQIANLEDITFDDDEGYYYNQGQSVKAAYKLLDTELKDLVPFTAYVQYPTSPNTVLEAAKGAIEYFDVTIGNVDFSTCVYASGASDITTAITYVDNTIHELNQLVGTLPSVAEDHVIAGTNSFGTAVGQLDTWVGVPTELSSVDVTQAKDIYASLSGLDVAIMNLQADSEVTLSSVAGSGNVARTYTISQGGQAVGTIDIPKDFLVKSAAISSVTTADVPYSGAVPGDKYIDFVVNTREGTGQAEHIYLPVNDLVDVYTTQQNAAQVQLDINDQNVISARVVAGSIGTAELSGLAVTTAKIADDAVTSAKILSAAVVTAKIADSAVTTAKIANANVTTAKIADRAVTTDKIALVDGATNHIWTLSVYNGRLFGVDTGVVAS